MKIHSLKGFLILSFCLIISLPSLYSADKGTLRVQVMDAERTPLPGAVVEISSPDMMGKNSLVTNTKGGVLFISLVPSVYEVKITLPGFQEVISEGVRVSLDKQTVLQVEMKIVTVKETVTVLAKYPVVDVRSTTVSDHVTSNIMESLPVARDFVGYIQLVSGSNMIPNSGGRDTGNDPTGNGAANYNSRNAVLGSTDNTYYLEGVDITGLSTQKAGMTFNDEVILEEQVISSGNTAEYGGGKGVVTNIITKSGGNRFSGSINFYLQKPSFWGNYTGLAKQDARLQPYIYNKYDTAATIGGPILKDTLWFFLSGQHRNNSNSFNLSQSASSTEALTNYSEKRNNLFGKLGFHPSNRDLVTFTYFLDYYDIVGTRSKNSPLNRQSLNKNDYGSYSGHYQHIFGSNLIAELSIGHYQIRYKGQPRYPEYGEFDTLYELPGTIVRAEDYMFGTQPTISDNLSSRTQFSLSLEGYLGHMQLKAGAMYINESDLVNSRIIGGEQLQSLAPALAEYTFWDLVQAGVWPMAEFMDRQLPQLNNHWDSTSAYYDTNHDGILTADELGAATFTQTDAHGETFERWHETHPGENKVGAHRWAGFLTDNWTISNQWSLNAGVRVENNNYLDSTGADVIHMKTRFMPRVGLSWDIGGKGNQKLTFFYGHYSDPIDFRQIHGAGDLSGQVRTCDLWLANGWYTIKSVGSAAKRDYIFCPNTKDGLSREFALTYARDFGYGTSMTVQAYYREDRHILEDLDLYMYTQGLLGDPLWGNLALKWQDFGFPASGPPEGANYFYGDLIGAKRNMFGIDFELRKNFSKGSFIVAQYSYKDARGNSTSDKEALMQGDIPQLDPRNSWMYGPLPGTIPHMIKLYGTYRTPIGLNVGAIFYWQAGYVFTEAYLQYDDYINYPLNTDWTAMAKSGQKRGPAWYDVDLKFNYVLRLYKQADLELFLDIYNLTNNQNGYWVNPAHNNPLWNYDAVTNVLNPRRLYLGARFRF
jgi:hypothetical protein